MGYCGLWWIPRYEEVIVGRRAAANVRLRKRAATEARERRHRLPHAAVLLGIRHVLDLLEGRDHRVAADELGGDHVGVVLSAAAHRELEKMRRETRCHAANHHGEAQRHHAAAVVVLIFLLLGAGLGAREDTAHLIDTSEPM